MNRRWVAVLSSTIIVLLVLLFAAGCGAQAQEGFSLEVAAPAEVSETPEEVLSRVLDISAEDIKTASVDKKLLAGMEYNTVLEWSEGDKEGTALISSSTGQIITIVQGSSLEGGFSLTDEQMASFKNESELASTAEGIIAELGWTSERLQKGGYKPDEAGLTSKEMGHYTRAWVAYTDQGISTSSQIEVTLDARNGSLVHYNYYRGAESAEADVSKTIDQGKAESIAREAIEGLYVDTLLDVTLLKIVKSEMRWIKAPAVANGEQRLIWDIRLLYEGKEGEAFDMTAGGVAYIDAATGEILSLSGY